MSRIANIFYNAQQSIYFLTYDTLKIKAFNSQKSLVTSYIAATIIFFKNRYCFYQHICFHYALHNLGRLSVICNRTYEFALSPFCHNTKGLKNANKFVLTPI